MHEDQDHIKVKAGRVQSENGIGMCTPSGTWRSV
jgi:hypothetical protein